LILFDYRCGTCAETFEALSERPGFERLSCASSGCEGIAERIMPAPRIKPVYGWVDRGKPDEPGPNDFSTKHLVKRYGLA